MDITSGRVHQIEQQAIESLREGTVTLTEEEIAEPRRLLAEKWGKKVA